MMVSTLLSRGFRYSLIGVDVGAGGVRAAQVSRGGGGWAVSKLAAVESSRPGDQEQDATAPDFEPLRRCLEQASFRGKGAVLGLNSPEVEFHSLELPPSVLSDRPSEAKHAVYYEVSRLMTYEDKEVETRHWSLPTPAGSGPNAVGVAAPREVVRDAVRRLERAGLSCRVVDTSATALARFGCALSDRNDEQVWGVLDLGVRQFRLVLCVGDTPVLMREVGVGVGTWARQIAEALEISPQAAGIHAREYGLAFVGRGVRRGEGRPPDSEIASLILGALQPSIMSMAAEVKRSFQYVIGCYPRGKAADLILVGGGALLQNVAEHLAHALGIAVRSASHYLDEDSCGLTWMANAPAPPELFATALGLAMGDARGRA